ncbi:acetyl-coenzyme A synthetase N-terminal domain-containing protein [Streptomyces sp. NPDC053076]|uniref:acetyl-coenzyme A synthetase N-terminal domain-containing protein n=1 Tax=Streptomyces sp. NPDC053076 TaxID=3365696 RepID=UPI0037CF93EA
MQDLAGFWAAVGEFFDIRISGTSEGVLDDAPMPATRWFRGARLNYAEHALRVGAPADVAVISVSEEGTTTRLGPICAARSVPCRRGCAARASRPGTGWPATCPTPSTA